MAPSSIERFFCGITSPGSICKWNPRPLQSGHMPIGALKENIFGVISGRLTWPSGQASLELIIKGSPSMTSIITKPLARPRAVSKESVSLALIPSLITILSTIIDMSCFLVLDRSISSARSYWSPSMTTLTKPCFWIFSRAFLC